MKRFELAWTFFFAMTLMMGIVSGARVQAQSPTKMDAGALVTELKAMRIIELNFIWD